MKYLRKDILFFILVLLSKIYITTLDKQKNYDKFKDPILNKMVTRQCTISEDDISEINYTNIPYFHIVIYKSICNYEYKNGIWYYISESNYRISVSRITYV